MPVTSKQGITHTLNLWSYLVAMDTTGSHNFISEVRPNKREKLNSKLANAVTYNRALLYTMYVGKIHSMKNPQQIKKNLTVNSTTWCHKWADELHLDIENAHLTKEKHNIVRSITVEVVACIQQKKCYAKSEKLRWLTKSTYYSTHWNA